MPHFTLHERGGRGAIALANILGLGGDNALVHSVLSFRNETKTHVDRKRLGVIDSALVLEHAQRINELATESTEKNAIQQIDEPLPYREKPSFETANSPDAFPNTPHDRVVPGLETRGAPT